jgi:tetratricopeptide (TPR) repeat protein
MRELLELAGSIAEATRAGNQEGALERARELRSRASRVGLESAWVQWSIAVCLDNLGQPEDALHELKKAIAMDPIDSQYQRSFDIIVTRLRAELAALAPDDDSVPRLYQLLAESGSNDVQTHLVMARHHMKSGRVARARELLEALSMLAPISREVWVERARLERLEGNEAAAVKCDAEAASVTSKDVLFGIPRPPDTGR